MECPQCGYENSRGAKFCGECGIKLVQICTECRTENPPGNKFCHECGHPLSVSSAGGGRFASPETYIPKYLAERILTSKAAVEGERKQVTVLFADMKGSMELMVDRDPEEARSMLDSVVTRMMEAVHRYEGTVNQVQGDGIMALFGAPLALEDHALRACYAALAIQSTMQAYEEEALQKYGVRIQVRVGLNSGEVIVRTIGSDLAMDYSAIGQTTHLASRMEELSTPGSIQLTANTLRFAEGFVQVEPLGPVPIKGMSEPVDVFELKGATSGRTRFQVTAEGGLARFVGRQREMAALQEGLDKAGDGHGQVVAMVGEPGVGKSRLLWEFIHSDRTDGWKIMEGSSASYGKATPYLPVINLLKRYFQIEETDDHRQIREKVTGRVIALDESLASVIFPLLSLLEVPVEDEAWERLDPRHRRQRILDALQRLLLREAQAQPLVLMFEDLHWIDSETQALLNALVESLPDVRLLLLVNYREEYEHPWTEKAYCKQLSLDTLPQESAEELLGSILGTDPWLEPVKRLLIGRTEGNPFFLEECIAAMAETGVITGERGAYRLSKELTDVQVPPTVQAILAARMDRLSSSEKHLIQTASAIGTHVPYSLLLAIAEVTEEELNRALSALQSSEFLYEISIFPEREFTFKHALTHEVAYGSLLQERRRTLHTAIMKTIEEQAGDRLEEHVERLAHHAFRGEDWHKSVIYLQQAGSRALQRSAHRLAQGFFEQGLTALHHLPPDPGHKEKGIDLWLALRNSLISLGERERIYDCLQEAERLSQSLNDRARLGLVTSYQITNFRWSAKPDQAVEAGRRALALAEETNQDHLYYLGSYQLGRAYYTQGDYHQAIDLFQRVMDSLQDERIYEQFGQAIIPSIASRTGLAWCLSELGDFTKGNAMVEEAGRIAEEAGHLYSLATVHMSRGILHLRQGNFQEAITTLEDFLDFSESIDISVWYTWGALNLGYAYTLNGQLTQGLYYLEKSIEHAETTRFLAESSLRMMLRLEALLRAGLIAEAVQEAEEPLQISREHKERGQEARAHRLIGEIHSHPESLDAEKAESHYRQGRDLAETLGMRPLMAHCQRGLGALYVHTEQQENAKKELQSAADMYREMNMAHWQETTEEALTEIR